MSQLLYLDHCRRIFRVWNAFGIKRVFNFLQTTLAAKHKQSRDHVPTCQSWYLNRQRNERLSTRLNCIFHTDFKRKRPWKVILQQTYCHNVSWWFNTEDGLNNDPPDRLNRYFYQSLDRSKNQYSHKVELQYVCISMSLHFIVCHDIVIVIL